jgi:YbbR domain-containing protein
MWFLGSLGLAFFVWFIATLESDPIATTIYRNVPIQIRTDDGLIITEQSRRIVNVNVRAPQSVLAQLDSDDIEVVADVTNLSAGEHRVDLQTNVSRRAIPDPSPRWVIIELEEAREQLVPLEYTIANPLPAGFEIQGDGPILEVQQVLISGPRSLVEQVTAAQISLDLAQRRNPYTTEARVLALDVEGNTIDGVAVDPPLIEVSLPIQARSDIRQVSVIPNILLETLPDGYTLGSIDYEPKILLVSGPQPDLGDAPSTIFTQAIDLTNRTSTFEQAVNVLLTDSDLFIVGPQTISISVPITPLLSSRQFDPVPVEIIGLDASLRATVSPSDVTVLVTGPQILLEDLTLDDIRAVIDLNGLATGNYQLAADVSVNLDPELISTISVLPSEVDVEIEAAPSAG